MPSGTATEMTRRISSYRSMSRWCGFREINPGIAVETGKVAPVGDRDAQIVDGAIVLVQERHGKTVPQGSERLQAKYDLDLLALLSV